MCIFADLGLQLISKCTPTHATMATSNNPSVEKYFLFIVAVKLEFLRGLMA